jgi:hypothetical protein
MKTRAEIINESLRIRAEIIQIKNDAIHWNVSVRKLSEDPIEWDPNGSMRKILEAIESGLAHELLCIHVAGPDELEAMPSLAVADHREAELNAFFHNQNLECKASVQAWPYSKEDHARDVANEKVELPAPAKKHE